MTGEEFKRDIQELMHYFHESFPTYGIHFSWDEYEAMAKFRFKEKHQRFVTQVGISHEFIKDSESMNEIISKLNSWELETELCSASGKVLTVTNDGILQQTSTSDD